MVKGQIRPGETLRGHLDRLPPFPRRGWAQGQAMRCWQNWALHALTVQGSPLLRADTLRPSCRAAKITHLPPLHPSNGSVRARHPQPRVPWTLGGRKFPGPPSRRGRGRQTPTSLQCQIPWEFSVPLQDSQVGKSVVSPRTLGPHLLSIVIPGPEPVT